MNLDHIGKYRIVGKIGQGAMGEVYKAKDPLLNRFVAIKTIAPSLAAETDFRHRFKKEAQSAAALSHPNIVTIFDFGEEDGTVYMAMELLEGQDLREVIRARGQSLAEKLALMEQICDGVGSAHARGIVHRDLKPGNIHVQPNGQVKILDFGLARLGDSDITRTGTVMGTPNYMSPEQIRGQKADARSDVFSLGAVFYELLCHHRPFEADSEHDVRFRIVEQEPEPIRRWAPETPSALVALVERALAKEPSLRFGDAVEMGRALAAARDAIEGETVVEPGPPDAERTMLHGASATTVEAPRPDAAHGTVRGATALSPARAPAPAARSHAPRTVRPDPTVAGAAATRLPAGSSAALGLGIGVALALAAAIGVGVLWLRSRGAPPAPSAAGTEQAGMMTDVFVTNQVELARADLADRDYATAAQRAEEALKLNPESADAREVLEQARAARRQVDDAVAEARAAFGRRDTAAASEALGRVMILAPRHPVVAELSTALREHLRPQAEESRRAAESARRAADAAGGRATPAYGEGGQLAAEADVSLRRQDFASAAQKYLEARNAFERATRDVELARAIAARPSPTAPPVIAVAAGTGLQPPPSPIATPLSAPPPVPAADAPTPTPAAPLPAPAAAAAAPARPDPASVAAPARKDAAEGAVMQVLAEYKRAIESQDLGLFRELKPDLTKDEEKVLRDSFKAIKSQVVGITVESVQVEGDRATVRVTRQDVVNGRPMKPAAQTIHMTRSGERWLIR
jgi:serine/threonine-protein kinase